MISISVGTIIVAVIALIVLGVVLRLLFFGVVFVVAAIQVLIQNHRAKKALNE